MQENSIEEITRRTHRYWYEDGIWEIGFGAVNLLLAGFYLLVQKFDWTGPRSMLLALLQMVVIIGAYLLISYAVRFLKERITYPRTGYVAYRKPVVKARLKRMAVTGLIAGGTAAMIATIASLRSMENTMPLVIGTVMAMAMVYLAIRLGLVRLYFIAAGLVVLGAALSLAAIPELYSTAAFFGSFGLIMMLSGGLTLLDYMRRTRPADDLPDYESPGEEPHE